MKSLLLEANISRLLGQLSALTIDKLKKGTWFEIPVFFT